VRTFAVGILETIRYGSALALLGFIPWTLWNGFTSGDIGGALIRSALGVGVFLVVAVLYSVGMTWAKGEPFRVQPFAKGWTSDGSDELAGVLSGTAKETLEITRRLANGSGIPDVRLEDIARDALREAGHKEMTDHDIVVCLWPDRTALSVVEGFFLGGRPLARLRFEHVRTKWAAASGFNAVKMALLVGMAEHVTPGQHALAVGWNAVVGGDGFKTTYAAAQEDIRDMRERTGDPVSNYAAAIYIRSLLRDDCVARYFPGEAESEQAVAEAEARIGSAKSRLGGGAG
jgi:hypothetical protein